MSLYRLLFKMNRVECGKQASIVYMHFVKALAKIYKSNFSFLDKLWLKAELEEHALHLVRTYCGG